MRVCIGVLVLILGLLWQRNRGCLSKLILFCGLSVPGGLWLLKVLRSSALL